MCIRDRVSRGRYWLVLGGTWSEQGGTGCQHDELSENIWFAWSKPSNHWIFEEGKSDDGQTNPQTDRISSCRLDPFCRRGRVKMVKKIWVFSDPKWRTFVRITYDWADCTGFRVYKLTKVKRKRRGRGRRVAGTDRIPDFRCYKCLNNLKKSAHNLTIFL